MAAPTIVCLCHDVTLEDLERAWTEGFDHPETLKRYTGALMGPCQGKICLPAFLRFVAERGGDPRAPSSRPPVAPVRLGLLAAEEQEP